MSQVKMVDLQMSPEESKEKGSISPDKPIGPRYPYGTSLRLDKKTLEKLGITDLTVGAACQVTAVGKVTSVSKRDGETGEGSHDVEIQLTKLSVAPAQKDVKDMDMQEYGEKRADELARKRQQRGARDDAKKASETSY